MLKLGSKSFAAPLAALVLMSGGGVALAATQHALPGQAAPHAAATAEPTEAPTVEPTETPTPEPTDTPTTKPEGPRGEPTPSVVGKCRAYQAGGYENSTRKGNVNPSWLALEEAAGGAANVESFCADTLAEATKPKPVETDDVDGPKADKPEKPVKADKPVKTDKPDDAEVDDDADDADVDDDDDADKPEKEPKD